ncbi:unnamed protein product [Polarella glacialis]|uniref:1,3-beta-glucan synthase n=1 Tax=Polarella glacialis TaxID=89957 RepID=A0A813KE36_POLGL|nr:unnamed protein product [Polarella glacialis]
MSGFCFGPGASLCALVLILWSHALQTSHAQTTASPEAYSYVCNVPSYLSTAELQQLGTANCIKVNSTVADFAGAVVLDQKHPVVWRDRGQLALEMCQEAEKLMAVGNETEAQQGAYLAVNAWGSLLTQGRKCCTLLRPPYCIDTAFSASTVAIVVPLAILILLFVFSIISSWILPQPKSAPPERLAERESSQLVVRSDTQTPRTPMGSRLKKELLAAWMQSHCLRVLPSATIFAESTASLFSALRDTFDFQEDSARNQFHHLLSLWRSQVAMVADRSLEEGVQVTESTLLSEALGDLYVELLDGFSSKFSDFEAAGISERKAGADCEPGGAQWQAIGSDGSAPAAATESDDPATLSAQLAEMATYLLVWGEAGNVRFMPEVIYFITELALAAEPTDAGALYGHPADLQRVEAVIFDEWYENVVDVDKSNGKDKKKLHPGLEKFLPPDWNELFCDPARLVAGLLLQDGTRLFDLPHGQRFAALPRMDWQVSLEAAETKTHRELHSLWGVFASTHRIWLLHAVLFFAGICTVTGDAPVLAGGGRPLMGETQLVRFAAVGLLVPIHALLWSCARWQVTGRVLRMSKGPVKCAGSTLLKALWWSLPLVSYAAVRDAEAGSGSQLKLPLVFCVVVHYALSAIGVFILLFLPSDASWNLWSRPFNLWALTRVPLQSRVIRYLFWCAVFALKFWLGLIIFKAMFSAQEALQISLPGRESAEELSQVYFSTTWVADVLVWFVMWFTTWVLFIADTQLWFTLLSAVLGVGTVFVQRGRGMLSWASEDAVAKIPERFSKKVLPYSPAMADIKTEMHAAPFSPTFPGIWDRILEYMRYEDKIDNHHMGDLSFETGDAGHNVYWRQLQQPLGKGKKEKRRGTTESEGLTATSISVASSERGTAAATATRRRIKVPDIFREKTAFEVGFKNYGCLSDPHWPRNADVQWRLLALSRGLGLPMPRPFRAPYFPGITVLIPHYGESILMLKKELFQEGGSNTVPLMDWVKTKYEEEFLTFSNRMQVKHGGSGWPVAGSQWEEYTEQQWGKITAWASMRMQTLWRTVAGMCLYHPALQCHYEAQADRTSKLAQPGIWDPSDCFTCLVSMQMYKFFDKTQLDHTNRMFEKFPSCLKVAFIDCEDKGITAELDAVHHNQKRRYFSSLIDPWLH